MVMVDSSTGVTARTRRHMPSSSRALPITSAASVSAIT